MVIGAGHWWSFVLRGVVAIIFGLVAFGMPAMGLPALVLVFGFYAILDGGFCLFAAFQPTAPNRHPWWGMIVAGLVGLAAGAMALLVPGFTALALLYLIAGWAMLTGGMSMIAAIRLRRHIRGEWVMVLSGLLSFAFGAVTALFPGEGALAIIWWIGAFAILLGVLLVALGFKVRSWIHGRQEQAPAGFATLRKDNNRRVGVLRQRQSTSGHSSAGRQAQH